MCILYFKHEGQKHGGSRVPPSVVWPHPYSITIWDIKVSCSGWMCKITCITFWNTPSHPKKLEVLWGVLLACHTSESPVKLKVTQKTQNCNGARQVQGSRGTDRKVPGWSSGVQRAETFKDCSRGKGGNPGSRVAWSWLKKKVQFILPNIIMCHHIPWNFQNLTKVWF